MTSNIRSSPEGTTGRCAPAQKLAELCDGDLRVRDRPARLLAAAVMAGASMPDPYAERNILEGIKAEVERLLSMKPNPKAVRTAGQRLHLAITAVVDDVARAKGGAR